MSNGDKIVPTKTKVKNLGKMIGLTLYNNMVICFHDMVVSMATKWD